MKPTIVTITGPSCAGKSTLESHLQAQGFARAISTTTRPMREGEVDRETYYFITRENFEAGVAMGWFAEHVEFGGNYYGLEVSEVERLTNLGKPIAVVCEPIGQKQIVKFAKERDWNLVSVFVSGTDEAIAERFLGRLIGEVACSYDNGLGLVETYARRMKEMMTTERAWIAEAYVTRGWYDIVVDLFNASTEKSVIQDILKRVG